MGSYREEVISANDGITIVQSVTDLPGGRTLSVKDYESSLNAWAAAHAEAAAGLAAAVYAGTPVGRTDAGEYVPFTVGADGAFEAPADVLAVGVVRGTVPLNDARAAIVTSGMVNWASIPFKVPRAVREMFPRVEFINVAKGE